MKKILIVFSVLFLLGFTNGFSTAKQIEHANSIVGLRFLGSERVVKQPNNWQAQEMIQKEINWHCLQMGLDSVLFCSIGVRNWNTILGSY